MEASTTPRCRLMVNRNRTRGMLAAAMAGALAVFLGSCSADKTENGPKIPVAEPGKVASFALSEVSTEYDLNRASSITSGHVASDGKGNVFLADGFASPEIPILRMTSDGRITQFAKVATRSADSGFAVAPDGSLVTGGRDGLSRVRPGGAATPLPSTHTFTRPEPIGVRPDGAVIVTDNYSVWSVKDGKADEIFAFPAERGLSRGTVTANGTVYATNGLVSDLHVLAPGRPPSAVTVHGSLPGGSTPLSDMAFEGMTPAGDGGLYARVLKDPQKGPADFVYLVHIDPSGGLTAMARGFGKAKSCSAGQQYPALDNPCQLPWFLARSGDQLLALGSVVDLEHVPPPALAIRATYK
ncbi:hypothetical protein ABZ734_10550 [Streptomyces sp. NPDC006660]|uniref:hypothetical protein n=1 Tax=Streptomyces sp. NPDC006660 TaxID=3156901 RepID=UPI0033E43B71